jgi:hypothetical protein
MRLAPLLAIAAILALAPPALAETRMMSFDPASPDARRLTGAGVTVVFETRLGRQRVTKLLATAVPATAQLRPVSARALSGLKVADLGALYEIDAKAGQGAAYVRAFCPGSTKAWLSFSRISRYPLTVQAFGDDPRATGGPARACAVMAFSFRGVLARPGRGPPDPMVETRDLEPF